MPFPAIPAETAYSDIELNVIDLEPPGVFPTDQNSYWGQFRKVLADYMQANSLDKYSKWYNNLDPRAVDADDIAEWEEMVGVPYAPSNRTLEQRQALVQNRLVYGAFSRSLISRIVENFIIVTFGESTSFGVGGIPLTAGGITLFSGASGDPKQYYRVYFDHSIFTYVVRVLNTLGVETSGLTRELQRITPAGWTLSYSEVANILSYNLAIKDLAPVWYSSFGGNATDLSAYANHGTLNGGVATMASPGLLVSSGVNTAALDFDGVDDNVSVVDANQLDVGDKFSLEIWINADSFTGNPFLFDRGALSFALYIDTIGRIVLQKRGEGDIALCTILLTTGTTYHIVVTKSGNTVHFYVNGVEGTSSIAARTLQNNTSELRIGMATGASNFFNGRIDEPAIYNEVLTPAQVLAHYRTGMNLV